MDSTEDNEQSLNETEQSRSASAESLNEGATVGIPIMCIIQVPISVPVPKVLYEDSVCKLHGDSVVNVEGNEEHFETAMGIAAQHPLVEEAGMSILSAAMLFKHKHPDSGVKVFFSPIAGVKPEEEID
jgi:hypothetical protein